MDDLQEDIEGDIDIFFLKVDQDGDFSAIDSDKEFDQVSAAFEEIMDEKKKKNNQSSNIVIRKPCSCKVFLILLTQLVRMTTSIIYFA